MNCPIIGDDIHAAENIFGLGIGLMKGIMMDQSFIHVEKDQTAIPLEVQQLYKEATPGSDIMKVNHIVFLITISHHIHFGTAEFLPNGCIPTILASIIKVCGYTCNTGFESSISSWMDNLSCSKVPGRTGCQLKYSLK